MKKIFALIFLFACNNKESNFSLSPEEFNSKMKNATNAILIDVRTDSEISDGIISGAKVITYDDSFTNKIGGLPKDAPIFVYCTKAKRSEKAATILRKEGFKNVYQLSGGLDAWREAKMPIELPHQ